jgi:hypothetical protein
VLVGVLILTIYLISLNLSFPIYKRIRIIATSAGFKDKITFVKH